MRLVHLGDALEFWKGGLADLLADRLDRIQVLPMFTDDDVPGTWTRERLGLYA
jgi:hypothetical protein